MNLKKFESLVIAVNEEQMDLGHEGFYTFFVEYGMAITNPFMDESGRFEVEPESHYGEQYFKGHKGLKALYNVCRIVKSSKHENMYFILQRHGNDDYSYAFDDSSCRGTYKQIEDELKECGHDEAIEALKELDYLEVKEFNCLFKIENGLLCCTLGFTPTQEELESTPEDELWGAVSDFYPLVVERVNNHYGTNFKANTE